MALLAYGATTAVCYGYEEWSGLRSHVGLYCASTDENEKRTHWDTAVKIVEDNYNWYVILTPMKFVSHAAFLSWLIGPVYARLNLIVQELRTLSGTKLFELAQQSLDIVGNHVKLLIELLKTHFKAIFGTEVTLQSFGRGLKEVITWIGKALYLGISFLLTKFGQEIMIYMVELYGIWKGTIKHLKRVFGTHAALDDAHLD